MDGELPKVQCKTDADFRKTPSYLDTNAYITLSPEEQRPRKIVIRIPPYTDLQLIVDALKDYNVTANRTSMMKSRKTGRPMPLYVVNVKQRAKFEEIYNINEICYIRVTIEIFTGTSIFKQCYRCQNFGPPQIFAVSDTPKCAKCAGTPRNADGLNRSE